MFVGPLSLLFLVAIQTSPKTVLDGVYSTAQADRGHGFYTAVCGSCHGASLQGVSAPPLTGTRFIERWREGTLDPLYQFIKDRMPFGRPANAKTIPDNEYLDILTYILNVNGYRAGTAELSTGMLRSVFLVGVNGPQPVPDGAHIVTVGCLSRAGDDAWALSDAAEPARIPLEDTSSSSQQKLGSLTFRLADLEAVPDFSAPVHQGHKVLVKGFLTRQPNAERISLTSAAMLDSKCER
jgi:mono/diheme cytochrome c family protein